VCAPRTPPVAVGVAAIAISPWRDSRTRSARADMMTTKTDVGGRPRTSAIRPLRPHSRRFAGWPTAAITSSCLTRRDQRTRKRISAADVRPLAAQPSDRDPPRASSRQAHPRTPPAPQQRPTDPPTRSPRRRAEAKDLRRASDPTTRRNGDSVTAADDIDSAPRVARDALRQLAARACAPQCKAQAPIELSRDSRSGTMARLASRPDRGGGVSSRASPRPAGSDKISPRTGGSRRLATSSTRRAIAHMVTYADRSNTVGSWR
jgi:hypothetical protein